ncbi:MAG: gamma carbonic anhydrase family protein [Chromatiales bacterium]|jgi:carbonic anhydrase/acetyltransferase-like protein (isoleucine patch superfamily)
MPPVRSFDKHHPGIHASAWIDPTALVIGDVILGAESSIWPMCVVRGDVNSIRIGIASNIQDGCVLHVSHAGEYGEGAGLVIGDEVTVGHKAILHACNIGNRCLIGMGSVVMDRAVVGDDVMLGAGSLVPEGMSLESGYLYLGRPAVKKRRLSEREHAWLKYSAAHYVRLMQRHRESLEKR